MLNLRSLFIFILVLGFAAHQMAAQQAKPDFSGIWILNQGASNGYGEDLSGYKEVKMEIIHRDPEFKVITRGISDGIIRQQSSYYTNGSGEVDQVGDASYTSRTSWDGNKIVTKGVRGGVEIKTEWQLSKDGKRLTENTKFTTRVTLMWNGKVERVDEHTIKLLRVYDKEAA